MVSTKLMTIVIITKNNSHFKIWLVIGHCSVCNILSTSDVLRCVSYLKMHSHTVKMISLNVYRILLSAFLQILICIVAGLKQTHTLLLLLYDGWNFLFYKIIVYKIKF